MLAGVTQIRLENPGETTRFSPGNQDTSFQAVLEDDFPFGMIY